MVNLGLNVIGFSKGDAFGLGETGAMLNPQARWALRNEGHVILDIGYGVYGAKTLNLVEGADRSKELQVLAVINATRPMTGSLEAIQEYILSLGRVDAVVSNSHLGNETTPEIIMQGHKLIGEAAGRLSLPVAYLAVDERWRHIIIPEQVAAPVKYIHRYMPQAIW